MKNKIPHKVTGWMMAYYKYSKYVLIVSCAKTKKEAIEEFISAGFDVQNTKHIRHCCIVGYPGPPEVQKLPELNWQKITRPVRIERSMRLER